MRQGTDPDLLLGQVVVLPGVLRDVAAAHAAGQPHAQS